MPDLVEVRALQTRLSGQPRDVDTVLPRLNELKLQVRQIEVVPRRLTPPHRSGAATPAVKPYLMSWARPERTASLLPGRGRG